MSEWDAVARWRNLNDTIKNTNGIAPDKRWHLICEAGDLFQKQGDIYLPSTRVGFGTDKLAFYKSFKLIK